MNYERIINAPGEAYFIPKTDIVRVSFVKQEKTQETKRN